MRSKEGIDNWRKRWKEKAKILETIYWPNFRRNTKLMEGIESSKGYLDYFYTRAIKLGVDPVYLEDSAYGNPDTKVIAGYPMTATSIRMGCFVKTIADFQGDHLTWKGITVLDIGGGYGAMAHALSKRYILAKYYVLDDPACIELQQKFIKESVGLEAKVWDGQTFDLVINTNSFGEMDHDDVEYYFDIIKQHLVPGGVFYTSNRINRVVDFKAYPYGFGWRYPVIRYPYNEKAWVECLAVRDRNNNSKHPMEILKNDGN